MSGPWTEAPIDEDNALGRRRAQITEAEAIMRLHQPAPDSSCARCARVGLTHDWPCGPYERAAEVVHGPGPRLGVLLVRRSPDRSP